MVHDIHNIQNIQYMVLYAVEFPAFAIVNILQSNYNTVCVMSGSKYTNPSQLQSASISQYIFNIFVLL